jgi:RimJ/RimL family protein N-acetyltransferase
MYKAASVFLRADITREDIDNIITWMENDSVTRYMHDGYDTALMLRELSVDTPEHLYSLKLSDGGLFYMIDGSLDDESPEPVGFLRLEEYAHRRYELVFAIGREELWGQGLGSAAVKDALSVAFFEFRAHSVRALVRRENSRSARVLTRNGFLPGYDGGRLMEYSLTFWQYLTYLQKMHSK